MSNDEPHFRAVRSRNPKTGEADVTIYLDTQPAQAAGYMPMSNVPILMNDLHLALMGQKVAEQEGEG